MCDTLSRVVLFVLNGAFLILSLAMIGVGIALVVDPEGLISFAEGFGLDFSIVSEVTGGQFENILHAGGWFMIGVGVFTIIISFIGFCGAIKQSSCLLCAYGILVLAIVAGEVALIVFVVVYPGTLTDKGGEIMQKALVKSYKSDVEVDSQGILSNASLEFPDVAWFVTQLKLGCCGGASPDDYKEFSWKNCGTRCANSLIPISCCTLKEDITKDHFPRSVSDFKNFELCMSPGPAGDDFRNTYGCSQRIVDEIKSVFNHRNTIVYVVVAIIIAIEIAIAILACCARK